MEVTCIKNMALILTSTKPTLKHTFSSILVRMSTHNSQTNFIHHPITLNLCRHHQHRPRATTQTTFQPHYPFLLHIQPSSSSFTCTKIKEGQNPHARQQIHILSITSFTPQSTQTPILPATSIHRTTTSNSQHHHFNLQIKHTSK